MSPPAVGILVGAVLGLLDGLSAWFYPEARSMMIPIVIGSTLKGVLTGLAAGLVARWRKSLALGLAAGVGVGFVLSVLAATGQPDQYWSIVLPGMLVGAIAAIASQRARAALVLLIALLPLVASADQPGAEAKGRLAVLDPFIGRWTGTSEGQPGRGSVDREYTRLFGTRFVQLRNRNVYPPQERNPKGEEHEDIGIFSFDTARKRIVFRQFHIEGFVNQYVQQGDSGALALTFESEAIENIPGGWRARETYTFHGPDELEEVFELAGPGKPFDVYSRVRLKRVK
jgi:hypothetical protein